MNFVVILLLIILFVVASKQSYLYSLLLICVSTFVVVFQLLLVLEFPATSWIRAADDWFRHVIIQSVD